MKCRIRVCSMFLAMCLFISLLSIPVHAENTRRTIKIGYIGYDSFIGQSSEGEYEGYGVEYLNKIAEYTNLDYEYIYASWADCLSMLANQEIDMVCCAKFSADRAKIYDYSTQSFGRMEGILYTRADNEELYYEDYTHFEGRKIAFLKDSLNAMFFEEYADQNHFSYEAVYYDSDDAMADALQDGSVDAIATDHLARHDDFKMIGRFSSQPFYLMSYQGNDFMADIDLAMSEISIKDPTYANDLFQKYYGKQLNTLCLTREETDYIASAGKITVGQIPNRYCMSHADETTGELTGINEDVLQKIAEISGLQLESQAITLNTAPLKALKNKDFDLVMGVVDCDNFRADPEIKLSDDYISSTVAVVMRKGEVFDSSDTYTVGVKKSF